MGRIAGIKVKGKLTVDLDTEVPLDNFLSMFQGIDQKVSGKSIQPISPSNRIQSPHYYSSSTYPVSAQIFDYPSNYINPPQ
ncbi:hypothetical protein K9N68_37295 (plasmid) [Kovacikia minuta CCNUW1]|uniref:hypothetical protein n=1 Tax=Kovacikia minuta TaxID=2931930 RepID=UPI001CCEFBE4|nr:hypothetical protein [Kovacikia minuta]UBF29869.1 hypothetical protein K9N68_37295 [Kovacikia minuta CCNUW1]